MPRPAGLARRGECKNLIGVIADGAEAGAISDDEMMAMMIVLLIGGVSTVAGAAASSLMFLAQNPDIGVRIRRDPALAANHLEESLRLDPPVSLVMRFAAEGAVIDHTAVAPGTPVYVMLSVACRDPEKFADPLRFDLDRANAKDHLAFGYGMHTCIGNAITRNVVPLLISKIAERFPNLAIADTPDAIEYDTSTPRARHLKRLLLTVKMVAKVGSNERPGQKLAVVVGAGGMGMAVARRLGQSHRLLLVDRDGDHLQRQIAALHLEGYVAAPAVCNVADAAAVSAIAATVAQHGGFRTLVHVVGLSLSMGDWPPS